MKTLTDEQMIISAVNSLQCNIENIANKSVRALNTVTHIAFNDNNDMFYGMCKEVNTVDLITFCTIDEFNKCVEEMSESKWLHPLGLAQNAVQHNITEDILSRSRKFK